MQCPVCDTTLDLIRVAETDLATCEVCHGYWIDRSSLHSVFEHWTQAVNPASRRQKYAGPNPHHGHCPNCNQNLSAQTLGRAGVTTLFCASCSGMWVLQAAIPFLIRWWKGNRYAFRSTLTSGVPDISVGLVHGDIARAYTFPHQDLNAVDEFPLVVVSIIVLCTCGLFLAPPSTYSSALVFVPAQFFADPLHTAHALVASLFLHADPMHLFGNMYFLFVFGDNVEDRIGHLKFVVLFLVLGCIASLGHGMLTDSPNIPTLGASGAVSGIMGAYMYLFPNVRMRIHKTFFNIPYALELPAWIYIGVWFVFLQFVYAALSPGIAVIAHLSGLAAGYAVLWLMKKTDLL